MNTSPLRMLDRAEYIEQAYLFKSLQHRKSSSEPVQDMLRQIREEVLSTTQLPMAIDFMLSELRHVGTMSTAMKRLPHYFTPFQTFVIANAEDDHGRFDMQIAFLVLEAEAKFRSAGSTPVAMFFFQVETLCRNRLDYDYGLQSIAMDPIYDGRWQRWILEVRHQLGIIELADLIYVNSEYYVKKNPEEVLENAPFFGEGEGRIALANRKKEPHFLFASLQRQLGYPAVPRPTPKDAADELVPKLARTVQRLETRIKLLEEEQRQSGIDLKQFMPKSSGPGS